jgi:AcrR family transcriptional regulator
MPREVDHDARRAAVCAAAASLIADGGIAEATLRAVAKAAGMTTGSIVPYFADKQALLVATFEHSLRSRRTLRVIPASADEALLASLEGALPLDNSRRRHWLVTVAFTAVAAGDTHMAAVQRDAYRQFRNSIAALVGGDEHLAEQLIAAADGVAIQALFDPDHWTPDRQLAALHAALIRVLPALVSRR